MALAAIAWQPQAHGAEFDGHGGRTMGTAGDFVDRLFAIVGRPDGKLVNLCPGPSPDSRCSRTEADHLPCAGARVMPLRGLEYARGRHGDAGIGRGSDQDD